MQHEAKMMIPLKTLPFRVERTEELFTPHAGLPLAVEVIRRLGGEGWKALPRPGSNRGIKPEVYVEVLAATLMGGGASAAETRVVREDGALREMLGWKRVPGEDAILKWLEKMGRGWLWALENLGRRAAEAGVRAVEETIVTVDLDATFIEAHKREARMSYVGEPGYMPLVVYERETGACVWWEFRDGNRAPQEGNAEAVKEIYERLRRWGKRMRLCSDSAGYQAEVFNFCGDKGITFFIAADQDSAVREVIREIPEGEWRPRPAGAAGEEIAETVHSMEKTKEAFRLVVVRKPNERPDLYDGKWRHFALATNAEGMSAEEAVEFYHQRGASENDHKELKSGFGMRWMPSGKFSLNAAFFAVGVLAHNAAVVMKQKLFSPQWWKKTIGTFRWEVFETAGRWVRHARVGVLKACPERSRRMGGIGGERWEAFRSAYEKVWAFSP